MTISKQKNIIEMFTIISSKFGVHALRFMIYQPSILIIFSFTPSPTLEELLCYKSNSIFGTFNMDFIDKSRKNNQKRSKRSYKSPTMASVVCLYGCNLENSLVYD